MADKKTFDEIAFIKEHRPELFICTGKELLRKTRDALYELEYHLKALKARSIDPTWRDPDEVLQKIEWICEECGWEGVGR